LNEATQYWSITQRVDFIYLFLFSTVNYSNWSTLQIGNTFVFVLYLIAKHPRVQKRLYEELLQVAPGRCSLTADTLRKANYLQACIMEAFR